MVAWAATLAAFWLVPQVSRAGASVLIEDIGLQSHVPGTPEPVRLRVRVTNPAATAQALEVVAAVGPDLETPAVRYRAATSLGPGEGRIIDLPILAGVGDKVEVTALDPAGRLLGQTGRELRESRGALVGILCVDEAVCRAAQSRISFSGSDEDRVAKRRSITFEFVRQAPHQWWGWQPARAVVLAAPPADLAPAQREALELFARHGGLLVLVEEAMRDREFLRAYGAGLPGSARVLGRGRLHRAPSVSSAAFDEAFTGQTLQPLVDPRVASASEALHWARRRLATSLSFPGLGWVIGWLIAYIALVGPLNFWVLRRLRRVEWAWFTVPFIAVAVGGALYAASAARRPAELLLDQIAVEWMDDASPMAAVDLGLRLVSPERGPVTVPLPEMAVLSGPHLFRRHPPPIRSLAVGGGWNVRLSPGPAMEVPVLQWSVADIDLQTVRRLPGTVHRAGGGRIVNETGLAFAQALFVDRDSVYMLGEVGVGVTVDIGSARREALRAHTGKCWPYWPYPRALVTRPASPGPCEGPAPGEIDRLRREPFSLLELVRGWGRADIAAAFETRSGLFLGLAATPSMPTGPGLPKGRRYTVTVVSFAPAP